MKKKVYLISWSFAMGDQFFYHAELTRLQAEELGEVLKNLHKQGEFDSYEFSEVEIQSMANMIKIMREDFPGPRDWMPERK
jgi:hypothetical protein